jgi:hypothetical protein
MSAHPAPTYGLNRSPTRDSFHKNPQKPSRAATLLCPLAALGSDVSTLGGGPSKIPGRNSRRYVHVQISNSNTVTSEEKSKIADMVFPTRKRSCYLSGFVWLYFQCSLSGSSTTRNVRKKIQTGTSGLSEKNLTMESKSLLDSLRQPMMYVRFTFQPAHGMSSCTGNADGFLRSCFEGAKRCE